MDEDNIIKKEKDIGMAVTGILKRKSRKAAMAAKKAAREAARSQTAKQQQEASTVSDDSQAAKNLEHKTLPLAKAVKETENSDTYRNGQVKFQDIDGQRTYFFMDGAVKARGPFDGRMQGEWQFFKNTSRLWQIGHFKDDLKDGKWLRFSDAGVIEKSQNFKNGDLLKE